MRLASQKCVHGHSFLSHPGCYTPEEERIGFLDIETSNLDADYGSILTWCILDSKTQEVITGVITKEDIESGKEDTRILKELISSLEKFDRVVTFYGKRFDVPFIRTRALVNRVKFPNFGSLVHTDLYFIIRNRFRLSRNGLENACRTLLHKTNKNHIDKKIWRDAARGDLKSLEYILDHNRRDVVDTQRLYKKVINFARKQDTSI
jgi:uncharacterized protein YprB with RNaseH-like and TPR domain